MSRKVYTIFTSDPMSRDFVMSDGEGNKVEGITEYTIRGQLREPTTVDITLVAPAANVQAELDDVTFECPGCRFTLTHTCQGHGNVF